MALLATASGYKLQQHASNTIGVRYIEAEGPTKEDNGEQDSSVINREYDTNDSDKPSGKESGWTNPLSWTDDGQDDD